MGQRCQIALGSQLVQNPPEIGTTVRSACQVCEGYFDTIRQSLPESPVPDQVAFRIDFPAWLATLTERDREAALQLVDGERTRDVAREIGVSKGRVSQIRRELQEGWHRFHGEVGA